MFFSTIAYDGNKYYFTALLMAPSLMFGFIVGKMCYMEDQGSTKEFLLSLPVKKNGVVIEKYIVGMFCSYIGVVIVNLMFYLINNTIFNRAFLPNIHASVSVLIFLTIYNHVYLFLNYKFDYSKTQFTTYIILIFMLLLFKFGGDFMMNVGKLNFMILVLILFLITMLSLITLDKLNLES